jgi:glycosyltransferase involved in cell wall biosynthesis
VSVHLYTSCWNEELIIPFFLRHYEPIVDRIVVYDDNSTDRTLELLAACPKVETRPLQRGAQSFLDAHLALFETCWQESRGEADWVCLADLDEFVFHPDWHAFLAAQKDDGVTIIASVGYDMVSESFPPAGAQLATTLTRGQRDFHLDKPSLFVPDAIDRVNHTVGRHCCSPTGQVVFAQKRYAQLRHYKSLGLDYLLARNHALASRLTEEDRARGWSGHYLNDDASIRAQFIKKLAQAETIPSPPRLPKAPKRSEKKHWWRRR